MNQASPTKRRLGLVALVAAAVFAVSYAVGTFTNYPEWMWPFVFLGSVGSVTVGVAALVGLLVQRLRATSA